MTAPNPPPEDPEYTSEPKVLSPVSPKPLHYPAPQNIPLLERQIDQAFNQTSAHMAPAGVQLPPPAAEHAQQSQQNPAYQEQTATHGGAYSHTHAHAHAPHASAHADADAQQSHAEVRGENAQGQNQDAVTDSQMNYAHPHVAPADSNVVASASSHSEAAPAQASNEPIPSPQHLPQISLPSPASSNVTAQSLEAAQSNTVVEAQSQGVTVKSSPEGVYNNADGVQLQPNLQDLLANLSQANPSTANAPQPAGITVPIAAESEIYARDPAPGTASDGTIAASISGPPPGLPPKPPAQEQPTIHPGYTAETDIRAYHPHSQHSTVQASPQQNAAYPTNTSLAAFAPAPGQSATSNVNGLPPPPLASFQQQQQQQVQQPQAPVPYNSQSPTSRANRMRELESQRQIKEAAGEVLDDADVPWTPETQRKYDVFLNEERKYVTEGNWEQFAHGSRLFVGNLSSERVTKRDIFHVFHRYGDLAQISIKQAYGFVQYLQTDACARAMQAEQGKVIRGKKIHLEVSKPQKNRNTDTKGARRSRSPEHGGRGGKANLDRYQPGHQDRRPDNRTGGSNDNNNRRGGRGGRRDSPGREDQYRSGGRSPSPSPRYRRSRDRSRDRYDGRYRSRSRSPYSGRNGNRFRSPTPPRASSDDDLPLPRRPPHQVPDVQILVLDAPSRDFISYIEAAFSTRGLRVDVLFLHPRLSLEAVIKRQILEGVTAVCQITRLNQGTVKIPLRVFDRGRMPGDVRFDEYLDLDPSVATELVLRAKASAAPVPSYQNTPAPPVQYGYGGAPYSQPQPPPVGLTLPNAPPVSLPNLGQPNLSNLITSLDPIGLQKLLGAMQAPPSPHGLPPPPHPGTGMTPDLAKLLAGGASHGSPGNHLAFAQNGFVPPPPPPPLSAGPGAGLDPLAALRANPALAGLLGGMANVPPPPPPPHHAPQGVAQQGQGQQGAQQGLGQGQGQGQPPQHPQHDMAEILARLGAYGQR